MAVAALWQRWQRRQRGGSGQLDGGGGSLAEEQLWWQGQRVRKHSGSMVVAAAMRVGSSSVAYADNDYNGDDGND